MKIVLSTTTRNASANRNAFTLVEVLVAVWVMSIVFVGIYLGVAQGFAVIQVARENLRATQILQEKMETIRLFAWDELNSAANPYTFTGQFCPLAASGSQGVTYYGTRTISDAPFTQSYSGDLKLVLVQLSWTSGKVQRQREMKTLVSQYGLRSYIYTGHQ